MVTNRAKQHIWVKAFKNGPSKIYGRHPLKNFPWPILEYLGLYFPRWEETKIEQHHPQTLTSLKCKTIYFSFSKKTQKSFHYK